MNNLKKQRYKPPRKPHIPVPANEAHQLSKQFTEQEIEILKRLASNNLDYNSTEVTDDIQDRLYDFYHAKMPDVTKSVHGSPGIWITTRLNTVYKDLLDK
jgi:hypothetical protein